MSRGGLHSSPPFQLPKCSIFDFNTVNCRLYSLALNNFVKGFGWAYKRRGLYPGRGGGYRQNKKKRFEMNHNSVDRNTFFIYQFFINL